MPAPTPATTPTARRSAVIGDVPYGTVQSIAGLMLFSGLRSAETLGLEVTDVDVGRGGCG